MGAAVFVDSFDGIIARRAHVKEVLPDFDGELLDNILDFLNYAFVPAFFLSQADLLPGNIGLVGAVLILLSSAYQFCQNDAKTDDHYFKGFPSYWNIMVFYMFILSLNGWINLATIVLTERACLCARSSTSTRRVPKCIRNSQWPWHAPGVLSISSSSLSIQRQRPWLVWASLLFVVYYTGMSFYSMLRERD